jgi:acyl-CoA reductase-like NAD-dependent aldehyde dehydrogenase
MWIAGAELPGGGSPEVVRNPATEEPLAEVRSASPGQVDRAVAAARAAAAGWRRTRPPSGASCCTGSRPGCGSTPTSSAG